MEVTYGADVSELFPNFDRDDAPLMASAISDIFSEIEDKMTTAVQQSQIPLPLAEALAKHLSLAESDEVMRQKDKTLSNKAHENLDLPNKALARAAWHAGETAARGAGVVGGTITGAAFADDFRLDRHEAVARVWLRALYALTSVMVGHPHSFAALLAYSIGGGMIGEMVGGDDSLALDAVRRALEHYAPDDALANAREALSDWSGASAGHALELMQEAQETDLQAMESLNDLFSSFAPVENAAFENQVPRHFYPSASSSSSSSAAVAVEEAKADEGPITSETLTPSRARDILIGQIKLRIRDREGLMTRLQNKIAAIAEKERQARALYFNPENKARHGGRRI